jgi:hypothetical protein
MFDRRKLSLDGAQAQALVIEKTIYAAGVESGNASACRYRLRVAFPDGAASEISCRAFGRALAAAGVGDSIPVRYDPTDRSKIELDRRALVEQEEAQEREAVAERIARGETALGLPSTTTASTSVGEPLEPDTGGLRIGDADRHLIAEVLSQHMVDGRLTTDELEDRLGTVYASQTRAQARSALASLPTLARSVGDDHAALVLPDWASGHEARGVRSPRSMQPRSSGGARRRRRPRQTRLRTSRLRRPVIRGSRPSRSSSSSVGVRRRPRGRNWISCAHADRTGRPGIASPAINGIPRRSAASARGIVGRRTMVSRRP